MAAGLGADPGDAWRSSLRRRLGEAARIDLTTRAAYSGDASIYRRVPAAVVEPRDTDEAAAAIAHAVEAGVPVTARGGGTSVAGNAIGDGLVLDFSRHMHRVLAIDPDRRTAVVQPGLVLDVLQAAAGRHGLAFGPDPSTHSRCTLGGMIGNNACGSHSVRWGTTADNTLVLTHLTVDGRSLRSTPGTSGDADVDAALAGLRDRHAAEIAAELGRFGRQVSGYALHHLLADRDFDVVKALVGSEGTCGVLVEATVQLLAPPPERALAVLGFRDVEAAAAAAPALASLGALTVEGIDADLLAALTTRPGRAEVGALLPRGGAWLYCETGADSIAEAEAVAARLATAVGDDCTSAIVTDPASRRELWRIREDGAGIVTRLADGGEAWPGWEDSAVPPERLPAYLRELRELMAEHGCRGVPYGHFGEGCIHLRLDWELTTEAGLHRYRRFISEAADLVARHGGSLSGEHGDGRARSQLLGRMYSPQLLAAFVAFKGVFDPAGSLNPGVLVDPEPVDLGVRPGPGNDARALLPVHALHADGGDLGGALRRCVGVGRCRQLGAGQMCPSYKATGDEVHSTRGRARVLSEMLRGESITDGWASSEVLEALDLCLSCKACRTECPVNVDMATYKAEFLHQHYKRRLRPRSHYALGWLPLWARIGARMPWLANAISTRPGPAALLKRLGGIEPRRDIPLRFDVTRPRAHLRDAVSAATGTRIMLWPDTFSTFFAPEVRTAAVRVLEALGYQVVLPARSVCCGLTWHSTGQLTVARAVLRRTVRILRPALDEGLTIVGLEPSCTSMLRDEAPELLGAGADSERLSAQVRTFAEVVEAAPSPWPFAAVGGRAVMQPHCHQAATVGHRADLAILARLGVTPDIVDVGCCGMAGNFGFEPGHWEVSTGAAALQLYPKVRAADEEVSVLADGYSCRTQIAQGTPRSGIHLAELLASALPPTDAGR